MKNNIIDAYYEREINNVFEYSKIILKSINEPLSFKLNNCKNIISTYIDDSMWNTEKIPEYINNFLNTYSISHYKLKNIINYTITYIEDSSISSDIYNNADNIILISKAILFALEIDTKTNAFLSNKTTYATIIKKILKENNKIFNNDLTKSILSVEDLLKEKIKKNISDARHCLRNFKNNNFSLNFKKINTDYSENLFIANLTYKINALNKFTQKDISDQIIDKKINNSFSIIAAELLSVEILKLLYTHIKNVLFILELSDNFFENQENVDLLLNKLENPRIKSRICLCISYKSFMQNINLIKDLKNNNFIFAIKEINPQKENFANVNYFNYVIIDDIPNNNLINFAKENNVKFIEYKNIEKSSLNAADLENYLTIYKS